MGEMGVSANFTDGDDHAVHFLWNFIFRAVFQTYIVRKRSIGGFPGGAVVENPPANAGDTGSSPGLGRSHMPRATRPVSHNY